MTLQCSKVDSYNTKTILQRSKVDSYNTKTILQHSKVDSYNTKTILQTVCYAKHCNLPHNIFKK